MVKDGQLCLMRDMVEGAKRQGWVSWGASVLSASVRWVWGRYLSPSGLDTISEGVYVDVQLLQVVDFPTHTLQPVITDFSCHRRLQALFCRDCSPQLSSETLIC